MRLRGLLALALAGAACCAPAPDAPAGRSSVAAALPGPTAERRPRVASVDYCADQFVLGLVPPARIAGLSPDATRAFSWMAPAATGLPQSPPRLEHLLALAPDVVVRSYGGAPGLTAALERAGIPVVQLAFGEDFDTIRANIAAVAGAAGVAPAGEALTARMDARLAALAAGAPVRRPAALYLAASGFTTGPGSLADATLQAAGAANAETRPGWRALPLEQLVRQKPAMIVTAFFDTATPGAREAALSRHPVTRRLLDSTPRADLPGAAVACGAWFAADAAALIAPTVRQTAATP